MIKDQFIVPGPNNPDFFAQGLEPHWASSNKKSVLYKGEVLDVLELIPDESVDCVWTDPPYNLSNDGVTCVAGKMVPVNKGDWDRSRGIEGDHEFNLAWIAHCFRILKPTGSIWVTGTLHVHPSVGMALLRNGFRILNDIVWLKPNPPPNLGCRTFTHTSEIVLWASKAQKKDKAKYKFNYEDMKTENGGKQMKSLWEFTAPRKGTVETKFGRHPTQKPVALVDRCIRASTDPGDVVLDPFVGSGSSGVAAIATFRSFVGIENSEEYLRMSIDRMEDLFASRHSTPPQQHIRKTRFIKVWFSFGLQEFVFFSYGSSVLLERREVTWIVGKLYNGLRNSEVVIFESWQTTLALQYSQKLQAS